MQYTISASENPQTVLCGTPPTVTSVGTIFPKMRQAALAGESEETAWEEWSVDQMSDPHDKVEYIKLWENPMNVTQMKSIAGLPSASMTKRMANTN